jgi:NADPH:quinone reductase-like Zn-dependent oxidoreductase
MKAVLFSGYGNIADTISVQDIIIPEPSENEVLVRVEAASLNPVDYKLVNGKLKLLLPLKFPQRLGYDMSGVIVSTGQNVTRFKAGDAIYARSGSKEPGTFAEYACVHEMYIAAKPSNISHLEASCIPLAGQTTLQAFRMAGAAAGKKILIHAGSGGVGVLAIQYAKALGMFVATTTSTQNKDWVKKLGADVVIDYKTQDFVKELHDFDIVYDTLGGETLMRSFNILKKGGLVVSISGPPDPAFAKRMGLNFLFRSVVSFMSLRVRKKAKKTETSYCFLLLSPSGEQLEQLTPIITTEQMMPVIDKVYPLEQCVEALKYLETGRVKGKLVLDCSSPLNPPVQ